MKTFLILALFASMASVILSVPRQPSFQADRPVAVQVNQDSRPQLPDETKEIILEYVAEKMEEAYPNLLQDVQSRANLFNLSAYLNTGRPANGTALTFVPLITLLSGIVGTG